MVIIAKISYKIYYCQIIYEGLDFVKQSTEDIFKNNSNLRKFSNTITDIASRFDTRWKFVTIKLVI